MALNQRITFKTALKKNNLLQVPKIFKSHFKLDPSEVLKVTVSVVGSMGVKESFTARMYKDGRIRIPLLTLALLNLNAGNLEGFAIRGCPITRIKHLEA